MAGFSTKSLNIIDTFAASMNLAATPSPDGSFSFAFNLSGEMGITSSKDGSRVLVSLGRPPKTPNAALQKHFLSQAGRDETTDRILHTGLAGDGSFVFVISIDEDRFTPQELEQSLDHLIAAHDAL